MSRRLRIWVVFNMTFILLLTTGSCGDEERVTVGRTLSDMLWINQNEMYQEMENCSDREKFFYTAIFQNGVCNDGTKMVYKQRDIIPTVFSCPPGNVLRERSCVKECVAVPMVSAKPSKEAATGLENSTENAINTSKEKDTNLAGTDENATNTTNERGIDLDGTGENATNTTKERGPDLEGTVENTTNTTNEGGPDLEGTDENTTNTTKERVPDLEGTVEKTTNTTTGKETDIDTNSTQDEMENKECTAGCYGYLCKSNCLCENNSTCDKLTGHCTCRDGWTGKHCQEECPRGTYGPQCSKTCTCDVTSCHPVDGCICRSQGKNCAIVCPPMTFGSDCSGKCLCLGIGTQNCVVLDGSCTCKPGWTGTFCNQLCPFGRYGEGCQKTCECESNEFCNPIDGECVCWPPITGLNCTKDEKAQQDPTPTAFPQSLLHISILVGGGLIILIAVVCTIVAWRRRGSHRMSEYKSNKDSTLKIVHADLPPREDLSQFREGPDSNKRTQSCKSKRKSRQNSDTRQSGVLSLPSRVTSKPPSTVLGFQQYNPTGDGSVDIDELNRHSYVNLKDEDISRHVQEGGNDYERLDKDEIKFPYQDYEVCVKSDRSYENVPAKKRSILGSLRKLVRKESHPESDKVHLSDDTGTGISRTSFVTFNKRYS